MGQQFVIAIYKHDIAAMRLFDTKATGGSHSAIRLVEYPYASVCLGHTVTYLAGTVGTAVIDCHNFKIIEVLP